MSSGSPSQIVQEVGGPARSRPEQSVDRQARHLPAEIVKRRVDCRLGGELAGLLGEPAADRVEREGVVAEQLLGVVEERRGGLDGLAVVRLRRRLAEPGAPLVADLDPEHLLLGAGLARDAKRRCKPEGGGSVGELHAPVE